MSHARMVCSPCYPFELSPLNELNRGMLVSPIIVIIPYLLAVTLSIISSNIYTRLAVCNCLSFTFRLGRFAIPSDGYCFVEKTFYFKCTAISIPLNIPFNSIPFLSTFSSGGHYGKSEHLHQNHWFKF